jgi:hypothetical protein
MRRAREERSRVPLLVGLSMPLIGSTLFFPNFGLAEEGKSPPYLRMDKREALGREKTSLLDKALKLDAVLAYAQEHSPAIQAAKSRLLAAQKVACPGLSLRRPYSIMGSLECS